MTVWVLRELIKMRGYTDGDTDGGIWSSGQSQALIHDIPSCAELVANIMRQAEQVRKKFGG